MKRITTLFIAAGMLLGATSAAEAADIKVNGFWQITGVYQDSLSMVNNVAADANGLSNVNDFDVLQRILVAMTIQNSENLKANLAVYVPQNGKWGTGPLAAGGGDLPVGIVQAFIDWYIPTTDIMIRMGYQPNIKTNYMNVITSPTFYNSAPGVGVFIPVNDMVKIEAQWLRLKDMSGTSANTGKTYDSINFDHFTVNVPIKGKSWTLIPWASYGIKQDDIDGPNPVAHFNGVGRHTYWLGLTSEFRMFDPFTFNFDVVYTHATADKDVPESRTNNFDGEGWLVDASVAYRSEFGSTKLTGWYSPGQSENGENGLTANIISSWNVGTAYYNLDTYGTPAFMPNSGANTPNGTLGLMLTHLDFEIAKNWHVSGHIMYLQGTNHVNNANPGNFRPYYLTTKDSLVEFSIWTRHQLMKNLTSSFEINYLLQNFDEDVWFTDQQKRDGAKFEDGLRANLSFFYTF